MNIYNEEKKQEQIKRDKKIIGNNIRQARKNHKLEKVSSTSGKILYTDDPLTQQELADKIGVSKNTISLLEKGSSTPSLTRILEICQALNICIFDIFKDTSISRTPTPKGFSNKFESLKRREQIVVGDFINFLHQQERLSNTYDEEKFLEQEKRISILVKFLITQENKFITAKENKEMEKLLDRNKNNFNYNHNGYDY